MDRDDEILISASLTGFGLLRVVIAVAGHEVWRAEATLALGMLLLGVVGLARGGKLRSS